MQFIIHTNYTLGYMSAITRCNIKYISNKWYLVIKSTTPICNVQSILAII